VEGQGDPPPFVLLGGDQSLDGLGILGHARVSR
jgi:hypothetical protein